MQLRDEYRDQVVANFERIIAIAQVVNEFPLPEQIQSAMISAMIPEVDAVARATAVLFGVLVEESIRNFRRRFGKESIFLKGVQNEFYDNFGIICRSVNQPSFFSTSD